MYIYMFIYGGTLGEIKDKLCQTYAKYNYN